MPKAVKFKPKKTVRDLRGVSMKAAKEAKIRNRRSYIAFKELYRFLSNEPGIEAVMQRVFDMLDARYCFGSIRNANYAEESLKLVLKDAESRIKAVPGDKGIRFKEELPGEVKT